MDGIDAIALTAVILILVTYYGRGIIYFWRKS